MTSPSKAKGSKFERELAQYLRERGFGKAQRRYGAGAQFDTGDITGVRDVVIEAKCVKSITLAAFMDETEAEKLNAKADLGLCVIKRSRQPIEKAYAVMSLEEIVTLLIEAGR